MKVIMKLLKLQKKQNKNENVPRGTFLFLQNFSR